MARMTQDDREKWDMMLTEPLPGEAKKPPTDIERESEGAAFMALLATETARKAQG